MKTLTIAYAPPDEKIARRLAEDLQQNAFTFAEIGKNTVLVAVISPDGIKDADLQATIASALDAGANIVLIETKPTPLPAMIDHITPISLHSGYKLRAVLHEVERVADDNAPSPMVVLTPALRRRNLRFGLIFGGSIFVLFALYTVAIALFDIEAPIEDFERLYTRDAATINAFAQEYIPVSSEQAANFQTTVEGINRELATIVVATATQAAAEGGFTPQPTGQIIITEELSEVRQLATSGALERGLETAAAERGEQDDIAATATQAAATANAALEAQNQTVTAAAQE
ncbi:MAG: hypothetical protein AAF787_24710 [Chloroflexota bacterium]